MSEKKSIKIIGPFITNYSYARVNRGLAQALDNVSEDYEVFLYHSKDRIDKWPDDNDLRAFPFVDKIWLREDKKTHAAIYFDFPKSGYSKHGLASINSDIKIMYIAWEESVYPKFWVDEINKNLHGLMAMSRFVRNILRRSGVKVPIEVVHAGVNQRLYSDNNNYRLLKTKKNVKIFHNSTGKLRKGPDVLIKAYTQAFSNKDDVCLVIKATPNPDNMFPELIEKFKTDNSPEIEYLSTSSFTDDQMSQILEECDFVVYPSRAEGFGLPIVEAMLQKKPVIATNYSSYLDFLDLESAWLLDYKLMPTYDSELVNIGALWAEPQIDDLKNKMSLLYKTIKLLKDGSAHNELLQQYKIKTEIAYKNAIQLTWENTAKKTLSFLNEIESFKQFKTKKAAVISPLNSEDGIAEYTKNLYSKVESSFEKFYYLANKDIADRVELDAQNVVRTWEMGETGFNETLEFLKKEKVEIIHIQYHSGIYFEPAQLDGLIANLKSLGLSVYVTLHSVIGKNFNLLEQLKNLHLANKVFIHNPKDCKLASQILNNVVFFPLPKLEYKSRTKNEVRRKLGLNNETLIIASHGYMNNQKTNIPEILKSVFELKKSNSNILFIGLHAVSANNLSSQTEYENCKKIIKELNLEKNVLLVTEFLPENAIVLILQAADVIVLSYNEVGESSSAAINKCIGSLRPVIVPDIKMFAEFEKEVYKVTESKSPFIINAVEEIVSSKALELDLVNAAQKYISQTTYELMSRKTLKDYLN